MRNKLTIGTDIIRPLFSTGLALAIAITIGCSSGEDNSNSSNGSSLTGTFLDSRDNKSYKWVKIGTQTWMAENLNYAANGKCYGNQDSNCDQYGHLYNWETAMSVCPTGWHLPNNTEWNVLMKFVNPSCSDNRNCPGAGTKLKSASVWNSSSGISSGTDEFGFAALPGGYSLIPFMEMDLGNNGYWWSASEDEDDAYSLIMYYDHDYVSYSTNYSKGHLFSVRCVQNN